MPRSNPRPPNAAGLNLPNGSNLEGAGAGHPQRGSRPLNKALQWKKPITAAQAALQPNPPVRTKSRGCGFRRVPHPSAALSRMGGRARTSTVRTMPLVPNSSTAASNRSSRREAGVSTPAQTPKRPERSPARRQPRDPPLKTSRVPHPSAVLPRMGGRARTSASAASPASAPSSAPRSSSALETSSEARNFTKPLSNRCLERARLQPCHKPPIHVSKTNQRGEAALKSRPTERRRPQPPQYFNMEGTGAGHPQRGSRPLHEAFQLKKSMSAAQAALKPNPCARRKTALGAPGPGSPRIGLRPWGGGPSNLGTWDSTTLSVPPSSHPSRREGTKIAQDGAKRNPGIWSQPRFRVPKGRGEPPLPTR